jgi:hypothetical protein
MKYYVIEPEVAGGIGGNTVMDQSAHPPKIERLHYDFGGWLGDALLESFPCFIATEGVAQELKSIRATGVSFGDVEITKTKQFEDLYPNRQLPGFKWLKISGRSGLDDFGLMNDFRLVISQRVLDLLKLHGLKNAIVDAFNA